jgi:hypothetical protein
MTMTPEERVTLGQSLSVPGYRADVSEPFDGSVRIAWFPDDRSVLAGAEPLPTPGAAAEAILVPGLNGWEWQRLFVIPGAQGSGIFTKCVSWEASRTTDCLIDSTVPQADFYKQVGFDDDGRNLKMNRTRVRAWLQSRGG